MIKNSKGEKCTPKQLAKDLLVTAVKATTLGDTSDMTDKEQAVVKEQLDKVTARVLKVLGSQEE